MTKGIPHENNCINDSFISSAGMLGEPSDVLVHSAIFGLLLHEDEEIPLL